MTEGRGDGTEDRPIVIVAAEPDPVASALVERWQGLAASEWKVDGATVRRFEEGPYLLRRPVRHIFDERLDARLPEPLRAQRPTLVFPSIHKSAQNQRALTAHPLGNPGPSAEVGGRPGIFVPTDPPLMTSTLRLLTEEAPRVGTPVTFEATHHGPELGLSAFFVEIGYGELPHPPEEELRLLASVLPRLVREHGDRVVVGVGGGHYVPRFTDLAVKRRWAFGHLLSRHALSEMRRSTVSAALEATPQAEGFLFARAADQELESVRGLAPRLREQDAPLRSAY